MISRHSTNRRTAVLAFCVFSLSFLLARSAPALVLDFQYAQNADLEQGANSGPDDLGINQITITNIAVGDGTFIDVTAKSTGGTLHSADLGIGVTGGGTGRLGIGETVALSFNRDVTVTGYSLNELTGTDNCTYVTPGSGGTKTNTSTPVSGLSLALTAGQTITFSSTVGDGIRIATLTVEVPLSGNDFYTVVGNSTNNIFGVLTNDPGAGLTLVGVSNPTNGLAAISGTNIIYSPLSGFAGLDVFRYTNQNNLGARSTLTVSVTVTPPPDPNDRYQVLRNSRSNVLDVLRDDGAGLTLVSLTPPTNGTALIHGTNIIYTPSSNYLGADGFTYTTQNGSGSNATRNVRLDVRQYPNFVFILADDQGWTGTSVRMDTNRADSKSDYYRTPQMEKLAADGMRFSMGYAPHPNCSPSRYANLTGQTCARLKLTDILGRNNNVESNSFKLIAPGKAVDAIQTAKTTTPELLKSIAGAGYSAAHYGKWHLEGGGPALHGFDADATDGATQNGEGGTGPEPINPDPKRAYSVTDRALAYLDSKISSNVPFYLQVSHYAVHEPIQALQSTYDAYNGVPKGVWHKDQYYAAMTTDLDVNVGRVLDKLDDLGVRNSTYVFYQADNGAPQSASENFPLRGYKPEVWEGGDRTPTFIRGPGVPANSQCNLPVAGFDFLPTIVEWASGSTANVPAEVDGGSLVPVIRSIMLGSNVPTAVARGGELVHHSPHYVGPLAWPNDWQDTPKDMRPRSTLTDGNYKLVANYEPGTIELYNLNTDIGQSTNLSAVELAIRWQLWVRLRDYLKLIQAQMPTLDPSYRGTTNGSFALAGATGPFGDADSDGLNDVWEFRELLTYTYSGADDPDQDGVNNAQEIAQSTDPLLPNACLISSFTQVAPGQRRLAWNATPGACFIVESSTNLVDWVPAQVVQVPNVFEGSATVSATGTREFFRVRKGP